MCIFMCSYVIGTCLEIGSFIKTTRKVVSASRPQQSTITTLCLHPDRNAVHHHDHNKNTFHFLLLSQKYKGYYIFIFMIKLITHKYTYYTWNVPGEVCCLGNYCINVTNSPHHDHDAVHPSRPYVCITTATESTITTACLHHDRNTVHHHDQ